MVKLQSLDPNTPMFAQLKEKTGRIVMANTFVVPKERAEEFRSLFRRQAEFMMAQPGFVTLQLHKGTADSRLVMNVAVWESTEALAAALGSPEFHRMVAEFPDDIESYPHIFEQIDV
ncbi:antibiotic biosynthesis monooxygenase [Streptomyces cocklensis]|jgi:quinol monooxygenase YgiN|uniref:Antibiotic biosynthesis monooxygenase n=1 Tax=Actinacidiphila cocklensis TaxID=887465 RepID=A0A9W4DFZ9_9ACTN|nr:antibiotic biosynthesis monooxygenase family protein [Actinacidiphila cocklensis]MDD1058487.1 antibiotic biosynthesis monooxygenase [Actinacidiphila cocklensis]WSX75306.1 antibiotic biosynthesis monooxygenase [Streptomyces sp. NBC_00899]CAG6390644.1 Antibiotic biosynthesis monooxygenase [Actinacidiphila cocklensis]